MGLLRSVLRQAGRLARPAGGTLTRAARVACALTLAAAFTLSAGSAPCAAAQTFKVLYSFMGPPTDGSGPAGLSIDGAGTLYGTTTFGGSVNQSYCPGPDYTGCGTVFRLDTNGVETVLHNFTGTDGVNPEAAPTVDSSGIIYGTTDGGGHLQACYGDGYAGCGVVFKLDGTKETVLYPFTGRRDGAFPFGGVVLDASGAIYGTVYSGGDPSCQCGVVFKLVGKKLIVLHSFKGAPDGAEPVAGVTMDSNGTLYGTTQWGGDINCDYPYEDCGVVFRLAGKKETILYAFKGQPDGQRPFASLFIDPARNLYGTTVYGGKDNAGVVFELSHDRKERILHSFRVNYQKQHDGLSPQSGVVRDAQGNLYGTTEEGGHGGGTVFEITADGKEKILHSFCAGDCHDGLYPWGNLIMDAAGNLYGTTYGGGINGNGVIFMITP